MCSGLVVNKAVKGVFIERLERLERAGHANKCVTNRAQGLAVWVGCEIGRAHV